MTTNLSAINPRKVPNNTVVLFGIRYSGRTSELGGDTRGRDNPKVYTYAMLKSGALWYVTGSGKVPTAAGWGAVEKWLNRDGRVVQWVRVAVEWADVVPPVARPEIESAPVTVDTLQA